MFQAVSTWPDILTKLLHNEDLSVQQAQWVLGQCIEAEIPSAQVAALLVALNAKGVAADELLGFMQATLAAAAPTSLPSDSLDIVGTGGDGYGTVNVSTTAAMIIAGAGVPVVKHGNRAATSKSGTSDVLSALGGKHGLSDKAQNQVFAACGLAFLHAGFMHPGFARVAQVRKDLGIPTVFNFLGPLCNPAKPQATSLGVADESKTTLIAETFAASGRAALVVRGRDGLDELTISDTNDIWQVVNGQVGHYELDAQRLGIPRAAIQEIKGGTPEENAQILRDTLAGKKGPVRDICLLNAASGLVAYELSKDPSRASEDLYVRFACALEKAKDSLDSGSALTVLNNWVAATNVKTSTDA